MSSDPATKFQALFARWARRIRLRQTLRLTLSGAAIGLLIGLGGAAAAWKARHGTLRPWMATAGALGMVSGAALSRRRRWSDSDVALYLDAKLQSEERISTALELCRQSDETQAKAMVLEQAISVLEKADPKRARPLILSRAHLLIPVAAGALVLVSRLPMPPTAQAAPPPGADIVQMTSVEGLEKIAALAALQSPDEAQRQRLKKIAEDAKKLRERLAQGIERREAQSELARLRDAIAAERLSLGDGERRAGLEAAQGRLAQDPTLRQAAKALGDRDLTRFDEEMQKLANQREKSDRDAAQKALEEAAEAAKRAGAPDVSKMLEEQRKLLQERSERADALRELGKSLSEGLPPDVQKDLQDLGSSGLDKDSGKMAQRLADALQKLTPEERKRLAERLREQAEQGQLSPTERDQRRELAKKLDTPEGQKELEDMLRKMANEPPKSEQAERDRGLGEAEKGAGEAEQQMGGAPVPIPMAQNPGSNGSSPGDGKGSGKDNKDGQPGPGSHHDVGRGDHKGSTNSVEAPDFRSRAGGRINAGTPMPGVAVGRGQGRAGESANVRGSGAIGEVGPSEVGGVERSDIPEEYREQVGRYFSP